MIYTRMAVIFGFLKGVMDLRTDRPSYRDAWPHPITDIVIFIDSLFFQEKDEESHRSSAPSSLGVSDIEVLEDDHSESEVSQGFSGSFTHA